MHKSVLKSEVLQALNPCVNENFIDATLGQAGHTLEILERTKPKGKVLGIEITKEIYQEALKLNIERLTVVNDSFVNLERIVKENNFENISGILFDLGFSTWHLKESNNGFSFLRDEMLDMRYNPDISKENAASLLNNCDIADIEKMLKEFGEERFARNIAKKIVSFRQRKKIETTFQLVEIIRKAVPSWYCQKKIHFATKTFQALRIAVNQELSSIEKVLPQSLEILKKGGRIAVISFHSLEDRIIKNFFREQSKKGSVKILTKKPIKTTRAEIIDNPSSRSAKLRAAVKL